MAFYLLLNHRQSGPYTEMELHTMLASNRISRQQLAWREGLTDWCPLESLLLLEPLLTLPAPPDELPPLPPAHADYLPTTKIQAAPSSSNSSVVKTVSGVIALILGILTAVNIGGCTNAQKKLNTFESGNDPANVTRMLFDTVQGMNSGDPLRGVQGLLDQHQSLTADLDDFRLGAWLCFIGMGVAGGVFAFLDRTKSG